MDIYKIQDKMPDLIAKGVVDDANPSQLVWESRPVLWFGKTESGAAVAFVETAWVDNQGSFYIAEQSEQYQGSDGHFYCGDQITVTHWADIPCME